MGAVTALVEEMTLQKHQGKTVVIVAGYTGEMDNMFRSINPGFASRFTKQILFPDWTAEDCVLYIKSRCSKDNVAFPEDSSQVILDGFKELCARPNWANARDAVSVFNK